MLEAVLRHPAGVNPQIFDAIARYTKLFWINTGPFNNLTARKFVPAFTPEALSAAVASAVEHGAQLPLRDGESTGDLLGRLHRPFFDRERFDSAIAT